MEKESRGQRDTVSGNAKREDGHAKGYSRVRASAISVRRSH